MKKILFVLLISVFFGCQQEIIPAKESFFKVYDDANLDISYHPIDIIEVEEGYLILNGMERDKSTFMGVQIIKVNEEGKFVAKKDLKNYVIPVGDWIQADGVNYFIAMNPNSLRAMLIGVDANMNIKIEKPAGNQLYPLASKLTSDKKIMLLSYSPTDLTTNLSLLDFTGKNLKFAKYTIGAGNDISSTMSQHFLNTLEKKLSFFCGEISPNNYYFNGFYNFNLSLVFSNFSATPTGILQSQRTNAGVRNMLPLSGGNFALAGYQFEHNYQLPNVTLSTKAVKSIADFYPGNRAELAPYSPTKIIPFENEVKKYTIFATETKGKQIVLYFYDSSGKIAAIHRIGHLNPFHFSSIKQTKDKGLVVLGTSFVASRFERVVTVKISEKEISELLSPKED